MDFQIEAQSRQKTGTRGARKLGRQGFIPAVVYGGNKAPETIAVDAHHLSLMLKHESFYTSLIRLKMTEGEESVIVRACQFHPVRGTVVHADFQRVSATEEIHLRVPLHFVHEELAPGVKLGGGLINHILTEVEVICQAGRVPDFIEVDLHNLELGHTIHLSDLKLPEGVSLVALRHGEDEAVVTIVAPAGEEEVAEEGGATPESGE